MATALIGTIRQQTNISRICLRPATASPGIFWESRRHGSQGNVIPTSFHPSIIPRGKGGRSSFSGIVCTIFGATGLLGRYVACRLAREGAQLVIPHRRDPINVKHFKPMGDLGQILLYDFDHLIRDEDLMRSMMQHSNVVINLLGRRSNTLNYKTEEVNVTAAQTIARLARELNIPKLIHFSALSADQNSMSKFLREKARSEEVVREEFPQATIIKPAMMYGFEDRYFNRMMKDKEVNFMLPAPPVYVAKDCTKTPVYVVDVAKGVINAIKDRDTAGKTYEFYGPTRFYMEDLANYVYQLLFVDHPVKALPMKKLRSIYGGWRGFFYASRLHAYMFDPDFIEADFASEVPSPGVLGLEDLGVTPLPVGKAAVHQLRDYRPERFVDEDEYIPPPPSAEERDQEQDQRAAQALKRFYSPTS